MFSIINKYNFATNFEHSTPAAAEPPPIGPFSVPCRATEHHQHPASESSFLNITLLFNHSYLNTTFLHWVNVWLETKHRNPFYSAHSLSTSSSCPLYPRIFWATYNNGRSFLQTLTMISTAAEERSAVTKNVCTFCWASLCLLSCLVLSCGVVGPSIHLF